ncbi:MAG: hypothetical protein LBV41_03375, partial [Cytophagaceae bacterium]|nr:hypothetical protein [Cytophagaceae bacterium]
GVNDDTTQKQIPTETPSDNSNPEKSGTRRTLKVITDVLMLFCKSQALAPRRTTWQNGSLVYLPLRLFRRKNPLTPLKHR